MASYSYTPARCTNRRLRYILPTALFLAFIFVNHLRAGTAVSPTSFSAQRNVSFRIEGRWKEVRASLGLPALPDIVRFPHTHLARIPSPLSSPSGSEFKSKPTRASRFDLKRKRAFEAAQSQSQSQSQTPMLHFASDALREQSVPLRQMAASFRAVALAEKGIAVEQSRLARLVKQGSGLRQSERSERRASSWGTRVAKISL